MKCFFYGLLRDHHRKVIHRLAHQNELGGYWFLDMMVSDVWPMTISSYVESIFSISYILFSTLRTLDKVNYIPDLAGGSCKYY